MKVYLWRAGSAEGVTDDPVRARTLASDFLVANRAVEAVVETAKYNDAIESLEAGYAKTAGERWTAHRQGNKIVWVSRWVHAPETCALTAA